MSKYRSKPVVIEAKQYIGGNREVIIEFVGESIIHTGIDDDGAEYELENMRIVTLEGEMMIRPGDYVIRGTAGEFYPCKAEIFAAKYEPVEPRG
jgi:hypothetical protein